MMLEMSETGKDALYRVYVKLRWENHDTGPWNSGVRPGQLQQRIICPLRSISWYVTGPGREEMLAHGHRVTESKTSHYELDPGYKFL